MHLYKCMHRSVSVYDHAICIVSTVVAWCDRQRRDLYAPVCSDWLLMKINGLESLSTTWQRTKQQYIVYGVVRTWTSSLELKLAGFLLSATQRRRRRTVSSPAGPTNNIGAFLPRDCCLARLQSAALAVVSVSGWVAVTFVDCVETAKDTAIIVAMEGEQETVPKLSNGTVFNYLKWAYISRFQRQTQSRGLSATAELLLVQICALEANLLPVEPIFFKKCRIFIHSTMIFM